MSEEFTSLDVLDFKSETCTFREDVLAGLSDPQKHVACKYLYDQRGSQLFDQICQLEEYYPTRVELGIMQQYAGEMANQIGTRVMLIEYGSGSSVKTRLLLDQLHQPAAYVPVDISQKHLRESAARLSAKYPHLEVLPVCADFTTEFGLPISKSRPSHCAVFFPGSTIGNLEYDTATELLEKITLMCGSGGGLLIGIDLKKDVSTIEAAYNDQRGVTAEFNLNLLRRINRELNANFDVDEFSHRAIYNAPRGRVEMHLVSESNQDVTIDGLRFCFLEGETICTEYSHKYTIREFEKMAAAGGLALRRYWTDRGHQFAVLHLAVADGHG